MRCKTEHKTLRKRIFVFETSAKLYIFFELPSVVSKKMIKICKIDLPKLLSVNFYCISVAKI